MAYGKSTERSRLLGGDDPVGFRADCGTAGRILNGGLSLLHSVRLLISRRKACL